MQKLTKLINHREYSVYGPNATFIDWTRTSDLAEYIFEKSETNEDILFCALGSSNIEERIVSAKKAIKALWYSYPELGPYPFLETLSDFEFGRKFYSEYREHVIHQLKVFLTGLYFFDKCSPIQKRVLDEIGADNKGAGIEEFARRWLVCAIYHDIGYVLENDDAMEPKGRAWIKTKDVMNQNLAAPLSTLPIFKERLPEAVEQLIMQNQQLCCLKISYPKDIEFDGKNDLLDLIAEYGLNSELGNTKLSVKSPLRLYYDYAISHTPVSQNRSRFRDHGIVSALLLMRIWFYYKEHLNKFSSFTDEPLLSSINKDLKEIESIVHTCNESIISAAGAIALHNITPALWNTGEALRDYLTLHKFRIRLSDNDMPEPTGSTPMSFLLRLADTLQEWDRPRFRSPKENDTLSLTDQDMSIYVNNNKIYLFYFNDNHLKDPPNFTESLYSKVKDNLLQHLEKEAIENIIAWGKPQKAIKIDWGEAPDVPKLYGRENELNELEKKIIDDRSRLIGIFGMRGSGKTWLIKGGIGKTDLSVTLPHKIKEEFNYIIWRRLLTAPPIEQILSDFIKFLSDQEEVELPDNRNEQILLLLELLQKNRCLLILDNFESILKGGEKLIKYQKDHAGYEELINMISEKDHQSCLIITSREKPYNIEENDFVKTHNLIALDKEAGKKIFSDIGNFLGTDEAWKEIIKCSGGNPLSLDIISRSIKKEFNGNINEFIQSKPAIAKIEDLLTWHFDRLNKPEKEIMYWLAINCDPISKEELKNDIIDPKNKKNINDTLILLSDHLPIEKSDHNLISLQPVLVEYMIDRIINKAEQEINNNQINFIKKYALVKAQSKKYVRDAQIRQILKPIKEQLEIEFGEKGIENKLYEIIQHQNRDRIPGYTAGNLLNFLVYLKSDLTGKDFSSLSIWQAYLQDVELHNVNFSNSDFSRCVFADTFGNIRSVAFSPNGQYLATASVNYEVQLWKFPNAEKIHTFDGHTGAVLCVSFSPDNKMIASGSDDGTIRLWDNEKGKLIRILEGSKSWVMSVAFSPDGQKLASGCEDHTVMIWDIESGKILKPLEGHNDRVGTVAFSSDSKIIASGSEDGTIKLWSSQKCKYLRTLKGHKNRVFSIAFDPVMGSNKLASASEDLTVKIWNIKSDKCLNTMKGHNDRIRGIAYNPDGRNVVSGSQDETLKIWNVETGECIKTLTGHTNRIRSVAYCPPDGQIIASVGDDQTIKLWETKTGHLFESLLGYTSRIKSITFRPESNILAIGNEDRTLKIWDVISGKCIKNLKGHSGGIWATAFNNNGTILASGSDDRTIKIWDADSGKLIKTLKGHEHRLFSLAFSPDNKLLVSGCEDQSIKIWDIKTWECKKTLKEHDNGVISVAFNSNGSRLASGSDDKTVKIWDTKTWKCIKTFKYHSDRVNAVAFNSIGKKLLSGSRDCSIKIWDMTKKQLNKTLQDHQKSILCIDTNPIDDDIIATGSDDMTIKIWKISTGKCIKSLEDHENSVNSLAFSSNGCLLASGSDDNMIRIWDCKSWQCLKTLRGARIYEDMNITGAKGLIDAQKATLKALGAVDE